MNLDRRWPASPSHERCASGAFIRMRLGNGIDNAGYSCCAAPRLPSVNHIRKGWRRREQHHGAASV